MRFAHRQRGAALFVVLLFSAFLAGLAGAAMRMSLSGVRAAAVFADAARADELGRAAGDILAFHLAGSDAAAKRGGSLEVRLPEAVVAVDYVSESARVDVNLAPVALIAGLLGAAGAEPAEVEAVTGRIARFRSKAAARADKAGSPLIAALNIPQPPGTADAAPPLAIRDLSEVTRAWGLGEALARSVLPALTVANGSPKVDPVLADRLVLAALMGGGDERVDDYLERRRQGFVNADSALDLLPVPARNFAGFKDSGAVRAVAHVTVAHRFERRYEMVLAPTRRPGAVPVMISWRKLL